MALKTCSLHQSLVEVQQAGITVTAGDILPLKYINTNVYNFHSVSLSILLKLNLEFGAALMQYFFRQCWGKCVTKLSLVHQLIVTAAQILRSRAARLLSHTLSLCL